ncbi:hypothetical protein COV04_03880 [Candidatus Uhrbacteria bacterium CG10_big_fil_rev_8_21_14_0_10_48_11]|uniref:BioF2-like acetyltransferase domain-containing protein n=1 Tax=Candidatus Uhrbacteria bacterium CG10_big_fil_rev_8_21_14_0_10_48_11 TaxID=1975037 RepID=A0A2M8LDL7_9BACT|nr:MAG: hypothetical protein COV04_03880 [Candidatus Uhrbacteria bacterium CG10_big_fil_rev_8_21_14_0_10_48_11]
MEVRYIEDDGVWNYTLRRSRQTQLLQSWEWGVFQQTIQRPAHRLQVVEDEMVLAALQCFEHQLPTGKRYLYAPRGPVFFTDDTLLFDSIVHNLTCELTQLAKRRGAVFVRLEPSGTAQLELSLFAPLSYRKALSVQPENELFVLTDKEEDVLLSTMHEKTRYNVRLAMKRGVRPRLIETVSYAHRAFPSFWQLLQGTAKRQGIITHERSYYERMVDVLMPKGMIKLLVAESDNEIIAANLLGVFGDTVTYLHGASSFEHRSLMAPYLLHWEAMRYAKEWSCQYYNLGGVSPEGEPEHRWASLTHFKEWFVTLGNTGERVRYLGALDLVTRPLWYRMYGTVRSARRLFRRY